MKWDLRPARDLGLKPIDRLRSQGRETGLGSLAAQGVWRRMVRGYLAVAHRLVVEGRENLPPAPPYVLIGNHSSHLDALTLSSVLRGAAARRGYALAAGDFFFSSGASSAFAAYAVNALPVWRRRTTRKELNMLRDRLVEDSLVYILFPEGTRSRDGAMAKFQPGLGTLVAGTSVPVVPCYLDGAHKAWPPEAKFPKPSPLVLRIGAPLHFADQPNEKAGWAAIAEKSEAAVRALIR
ncbi:lysophospholipid acyltransferase family protein [Roseomonas sp. 18066]|uniref:lysophospholipid acyltransferase family protein n=1 Tax=Roseomonas sp. 18066 TaxID=2681412 RepID=UPI00135CE9BC|nr:lysophospholipid acyltransferase family protein [Roseomonas sp. 18066]